MERFVGFNWVVQHTSLFNFSREKRLDVCICFFPGIDNWSYYLEFIHEYKVFYELMIDDSFVEVYL